MAWSRVTCKRSIHPSEVRSFPQHVFIEALLCAMCRARCGAQQRKAWLECQLSGNFGFVQGLRVEASLGEKKRSNGNTSQSPDRGEHPATG